MTCFPLSDISIRSGDIRDQSLKLSDIAPNFGRFPSPQILGGGGPPKKLYPLYHACLTARHMEKFREVTPPSPKVMGSHRPTLYFKPIFECSLLKFALGATIL